MFKYVKYILVVMVLGMGLIAFNQIAKADNEVVDVGENISFRQIDPEQAKQFIDSEANYVILDVRTKPEYEDGHIKNAISLPCLIITSFKSSTIRSKFDSAISISINLCSLSSMLPPFCLLFLIIIIFLFRKRPFNESFSLYGFLTT